MADVILSPLLQVVLDKLATPFLKTISDVYGISNEVDKFSSDLPMIYAVLGDAEEQQLTNRALRMWLEELKKVAYDLEHLIDEFSPEAIVFRNLGENCSVEELSEVITRIRSGTPFHQVRSTTPHEHFLNYRDLLPKMNQVKDTLERLFRQKSDFNLRDGVVNNRGYRSRRGRQTGSFVIESEVFGRKEDKEKIVKLLLVSDDIRKNSGHGDVLIVSVVGLGGLGKTTLARLAYNDERVARHFDLRIWVCVNDEFDLVKVMISIIEAASRSRCEFLGMDVLQFQLRELLLGKKYLLVLDDVWNEDRSEWDELRMLLRCGAEGSAILVTSRNCKVASIMGTTHFYHLEGLSEESCWDLFKQRAFGHNQEDRSNLFPIGKEIVKKCGGVPLAVKTLGSVMSLKRDEREWLFVMESGLWDMSESENGTLPALRLSYNHLPPHLKGCFAYCSIFPKNYAIKKEKLIQLWIAAGFIPSLGGKKTLEIIGNEYFNDLVWMFFFQDIEKSDDGSITECKMHDLIHDLAQSVAGGEFTMLEHGTPRDLSSICHSSVVCSSELHTIPEALYEAKKLQTLILLLPKGNLGEVPSRVFSSFRYLRALDLSGSGIKRLHESISSFLFLKFLDLSNTHIRTLPESVGKLLNLQVMNLFGCKYLTELPSHMANLYKLKHLVITGCNRLTKMPAGIGKLIYLQTLSMFIVGSEADANLNQLQHLNLGGDLSIRQLENVKRASEARNADIIGKRNLHYLALSWGNEAKGFNRRNNDYNSTLEESILNFLQPHKYLKRLSVKGYRGSGFPAWIGVLKLPNLTEVTLVNCRRCEQLPTLGQLPFLEVLYLQGMDAVTNIGSEFYGESTGTTFPSLGELTVKDFPNLDYWWTANGFPSLFKLTVSKCPRLKNMPSFPSLKHLELQGCNDIVLRSASNLTSLMSLVVEEFPEQLVYLDLLLQNNVLLTSLKISSCPKLHCISPNLGKLIGLKTLTVCWCGELLSLPEGLQNLTSLETLEIIDCHSLVSLPESMEGLISLRSLSIENCSNITTLSRSLQYLSALEHLTIMYCPKLDSLPDDWQHLSTLKSLSILNCLELVSLPEGLKYATALQNMEIRGCPGLQALPEWVATLTSLRSLALSDCHNLPSLPGGFSCLRFLQHLSIRECPKLEQRCKKDAGEDWPKMKHIAHVYIGSQHFRACDDAGGSSSSL